MFGGLYFGQTYFGGATTYSGMRRLFLRPIMLLLRGRRTVNQIRT